MKVSEQKELITELENNIELMVSIIKMVGKTERDMVKEFGDNKDKIITEEESIRYDFYNDKIKQDRKYLKTLSERNNAIMDKITK